MKPRLNVRDAAKVLNVTTQRIRQLVADGTLPIYPIDSRTYLIEPAGIARYQRTRRTAGRPPLKA